jgi:leader peptidase (prepilin peptidase) / N-methyltransferase
VSEQSAATVVLVLLLMAVTWIDARRMIIPNIVNFSLAFFGLVVTIFVLHVNWLSRCIESISVYAAFESFAYAYMRLRGHSGFGGGDAKFLGAATAWIGVIAIPWVVLIAAISGLGFAIFRGGLSMQRRLAFGPHLSLGLLVTWVLRDTFLNLGN